MAESTIGNWFKKNYRWMVLLLFFSLIAVYVGFNRHLVLKLTNIRMDYVLLLIFISFCMIVFIGLEFKIFLKIFNLNIGFWESFSLTVINTVSSLILPARGGLVVRGVYLVKKYRFSITFYALLVVTSNIFQFLSAALLGTALSYLFGYFAITKVFLAVVFLCLSAILAAFFFDWFQWKIPIERIEKILINLRRGIHQFRGAHKTIGSVFIVRTGFFLIESANLMFCFLSIRMPVTYQDMIILVMLGNISRLIAITPGNLSIREGIMIFGANVMGMPIGETILALSLNRAAGITTNLCLYFFCGKSLMDGKTRPITANCPDEPTATIRE